MPIQGSLGGSSSFAFGKVLSQNRFSVQYLVIAGGAGGGGNIGGGGGAGGYRCSVSGESSGGGASAESLASINKDVAYTVTVGSGGPGGGTLSKGSNGLNSVFTNIISIGGGGGTNPSTQSPGNPGGSGGGGARINLSEPSGSGTQNQGYSGGRGVDIYAALGGGGGGGASQVGQNGSSAKGGNGGNGVSSSITGTSTTRAGGGGGGGYDVTTPGLGGSGGGGVGAMGAGGTTTPVAGSAGAASTGSGGGAGSISGTPNSAGYNGGSGIVVLKYPATYTATFSGGVTQTTSTVGAFKVSRVTATSTTSETVTFVRALDVSKTYHYINNDVNNPFIVGSSYPVGTTLSLYMQLRDVDGKNITNNNQVQSIGFWRSSCISQTSSLLYVGSGIYKIDLQFGGFTGCGAEVMPISTTMDVEINNTYAPAQYFTIV